VRGQITYLAATYLGPEGIALGLPGPVVTTVPDTLPLASGGCDPLTHPTCSGSCQIAGREEQERGEQVRAWVHEHSVRGAADGSQGLLAAAGRSRGWSRGG
jgi:hypothetical protein